MTNLLYCQPIRRFQGNTGNSAGYKTVFGTVLAVFLFVGLVSAQSGPIQTTAAITPRQHGPMRLHQDLHNGSVTTENWSGFAVTGSDFTYAKGSWHVPEVDCGKTPNTYSAFWVGIDGYGNKTVEQTGTSSGCNGTSPVYYAWYEFYPAGSVVITSMPIHAGDVMGASVTYSNGEFTVGIHNHTTGAEFSKTAKVSGAKRTSAEWIAEAPCCTQGGGILPLADFDVANFGEDYTSDAGTNYATDSTENDKPIVDFSTREKITMVSSKGVTEAVPTSLTSDGTSFRVYWKAE
jgi:Peptidase A4 family